MTCRRGDEVGVASTAVPGGGKGAVAPAAGVPATVAPNGGTPLDNAPKMWRH
jgi:hypothetical protein